MAPTSPLQQRHVLAITFGLILAAFWPTLASFPGTWNVSYQEHGFFVAGLVVWLMWRDRGRFLSGAGQSIADFLPVLGLLSLVWMAALIMNVRLIHQALFVVICTLWALATFGWSARRRVLAIGLTALLAIPFWGLAVPVLQRATVVASGGMTRLAGISAEIGYDYIAISTGTFLVEAGCAGINYLMGGLVLGAFYAHLFAQRWQTQLQIVALAGAMSIVGNWIRVAALIFLGEATAMQSPLIEDHLWQGWLIFTLLMIPTYFLARRLELRDANRLGGLDAAGVEDGQVLVSGGEATNARREKGVIGGRDPAALDPSRARFAVVAGIFAALGPILFAGLSMTPRGGEAERDAAILGVDASWAVSEREAGFEHWMPAFEGIDDVAFWTLESGDTTVEAARHYFVDQRNGEELIQWNNRIAPDSLLALERLIGPVGISRRWVHEAIVLGPDHPRLVWYWYRVAGFDTPFPSKAKLLELVAFFRRHPASELVTVSAPCAPEDCTDAAAALRSALGMLEAPQAVAPQSVVPESVAPESVGP